jgi:hypothetical protein
MRTTIRLPDDLLADAKRLAAGTGRTLTEVIEGALREVLARRAKSRRRRPVKLTTVGGRGVQPGVDLDDGAALLDHMDGRDDAP